MEHDGDWRSRAQSSAARVRDWTVALSVVLSASASLLARSFGNLVAADRTIDLSPLLMVGFGTPADRDESPNETIASPRTYSHDCARSPASRR